MPGRTRRPCASTLREGVRFHDGEPMDAEAVRYSLNRHLTMSGSFRRGEIGIAEAVEVVDAKTIRIRLKSASSPFLSQLTDRAGMIVSPKAAEAAGRNFGSAPVCAGPYRFVERVAQDRIVVERFAGYWDAARIHIPRIVFQPIPDNTVRLANLQSGALEMVQTIEPDDVKTVRAQPPPEGRQLRRARLPEHQLQPRQRAARQYALRPRSAHPRRLRAGDRPPGDEPGGLRGLLRADGAAGAAGQSLSTCRASGRRGATWRAPGRCCGRRA